jgi:chromosome segregation protein
LLQDEEKLNSVKTEFGGLKKNIEEKSSALQEKEARLNELAASIKASLQKISNTKELIMELVSGIAAKKNEISDFASKEQVYHSRSKRLEIEKAKVFEEKVITEDSLNKVTQEVDNLKSAVMELNNKLSGLKADIEKENLQLRSVNGEIDGLEKETLTLQSHKEFLEKLKTKYEDIGESMNALIYLDKLPLETTSGLVIKIKEGMSINDEDKVSSAEVKFKFSGEAKPIELDTEKIEEKINRLAADIDNLKNIRQVKEANLTEMNRNIAILQEELRNQEISLANKETSRFTTLEQFNKIKEEEDIIVLELQDVNKEISVLQSNIAVSRENLNRLNLEHRLAEDSILKEEENISLNNKLREEVLVVITQIKTELASLNKRLTSDQDTLRLIEEAYNHDKDTLFNIEKQISDAGSKKECLALEIVECAAKNSACLKEIEAKNTGLKEAEKKYEEVSLGSSDVVKKIDSDRKVLDEIRNNLYQLQMNSKDIDYRYSTIKERILSAYKQDIETVPVSDDVLEIDILNKEIEELKKKLDSYGTVNLVAIEEYDELKVRYDFLMQQQNDLLSAKESLHQVILKLNRTTKQMFMETFEKVREEFKNYFKMLFNGGDAQVYLIDEQDPLESGIEIICRPPGKKLQNVLLLSGGEKSMSAIALIFAIFKVKPSPFCILDEIDAALDEANVDRFSRILQEFSKISQFIVITHNKKTIINANVMYGITMQQSGVSKIVSVKFADKRPHAEVESEVVGV